MSHYVAQAGLNLESSCCSFLSIGSMGMHPTTLGLNFFLIEPTTITYAKATTEKNICQAAVKSTNIWRIQNKVQQSFLKNGF
jgi:hypothetical protein